MVNENKYKCFGYDEKNEDGSLRAHCVVAISTYAGKKVRGYAKCHPNDEWDWEKGKALAIARCAAKIAEKRLKRATTKAIEAQDILTEASLHYADMIDYFDRAVEEVNETSAHVEELLNNF